MKKVIIAGIKGYYGKMRRRRKIRKMQRFHYTAKETGGKRWKQKLLGKTTWYRKRRGEDDNNDRKTAVHCSGEELISKKKEVSQLKTSMTRHTIDKI